MFSILTTANICRTRATPICRRLGDFTLTGMAYVIAVQVLNHINIFAALNWIKNITYTYVFARNRTSHPPSDDEKEFAVNDECIRFSGKWGSFRCYLYGMLWCVNDFKVQPEFHLVWNYKLDCIMDVRLLFHKYFGIYENNEDRTRCRVAIFDDQKTCEQMVLVSGNIFCNQSVSM